MTFNFSVGTGLGGLYGNAGLYGSNLYNSYGTAGLGGLYNSYGTAGLGGLYNNYGTAGLGSGLYNYGRVY